MLIVLICKILLQYHLVVIICPRGYERFESLNTNLAKSSQNRWKGAGSIHYTEVSWESQTIELNTPPGGWVSLACSGLRAVTKTDRVVEDEDSPWRNPISLTIETYGALNIQGQRRVEYNKKDVRLSPLIQSASLRFFVKPNHLSSIKKIHYVIFFRLPR